jgi:hypothetical protein
LQEESAKMKTELDAAKKKLAASAGAADGGIR